MLTENGPPGRVRRWCIELGFSVPEKETYMSVSVSISMYVWKLIIETDSCSYGG